jgi:hypothetical protein
MLGMVNRFIFQLGASVEEMVMATIAVIDAQKKQKRKKNKVNRKVLCKSKRLFKSTKNRHTINI